MTIPFAVVPMQAPSGVIVPTLAAGTLGGAATYAGRLLATRPTNLLTYLPFNEASGETAFDASGHGCNAVYTGVDLGAAGIGDGGGAPYFDGVNDVCNPYSAALSAAFNGAEGTAMLWAKVSGAAWTDGSNHYVLNLRSSSGNRFYVLKPTTNNQVQINYSSGSVAKGITVGSLSYTDWFHVAGTWSYAANQFIPYINGVALEAAETGLGAWTGALSATLTAIGAQGSDHALSFLGWLAHCAIWTVALSAAEIAPLARIN
jgi:hypothetical protein